jgi:hypothetical protein
VKGPRSALTSFLEEKGINARKIRDSYFQRNRGTRRPKTPGDGMHIGAGGGGCALHMRCLGTTILARFGNKRYRY